MRPAYDPEIQAVLDELLVPGASPDELAPALLDGLTDRLPVADGVTVREVEVPAADGALLPARLYAPPGPPSPAAVLHLHGGGMFGGSLDTHDRIARRYAGDSGVRLLAVEYRMPPEHPHPTPVQDCLAALRWLDRQAPALGLDRARLGVLGDSAGGGLAAAVALLARDSGGPPLALQLLVSPMLDDRTAEPDPLLEPVASWGYEENRAGWDLLLQGRAGDDDVPGHAAPARAGDLRGLPRTYLDVGGLDIFRDEDVAYAARLMAAGVPVELHVHPGAQHGFDVLAPEAGVSRRAHADRVRVLRSLLP